LEKSWSNAFGWKKRKARHDGNPSMPCSRGETPRRRTGDDGERELSRSPRRNQTPMAPWRGASARFEFRRAWSPNDSGVLRAPPGRSFLHRIETPLRHHELECGMRLSERALRPTRCKYFAAYTIVRIFSLFQYLRAKGKVLRERRLRLFPWQRSCTPPVSEIRAVSETTSEVSEILCSSSV